MAYTAKDIFDHSIVRAEHFLSLYDILHYTRKRKARRDWLSSFKEFMHWPQNDNIVRIDGKDKNSMLILREAVGIDESLFSHDYVSELLRASISASVSAMDRYFHDLITLNSWKLLSRREDKIPRGLKKMNIPVLAAKKAVEKIRRNKDARPGSLIKKEVQSVLHREFTFQNPSSLDKVSQILGIRDFWRKIANALPGNNDPGDIQDRIRKLAKRRNQIVHEADIVLKTRAKEITLRDITRKEAEESLSLVKNIVSAVESIAGL